MTKKNYKEIELDSKYIPKAKEEYMCLEHLAYFYQYLMARKEEALDESDTLVIHAEADTSGVGDESDSSNQEQEITMRLKMGERTNNLIRKIDQALERIENGTYGYSVISGEEIGLKRMLARPLATVTIEEQEEIEQKES